MQLIYNIVISPPGEPPRQKERMGKMSKATTTQDRLEAVLDRLEKVGAVSPYRLGKLESEVRGRVIPPQKIYGYVRQGYIVATKNELGKLSISSGEAQAHLIKVAAKDQAAEQS